MGERSDPQRLRDLIPGIGRNLGLRDASGTASLWTRWSEIVGEEIARHAEPTSLRDGVLRVRTESPTWATEIGYLVADITTRINETLGRVVVREIRVWTGPGRTSAEMPSKASASRSQPNDEEHADGPPDDPAAALAAARAAWERRRKRP